MDKKFTIQIKSQEFVNLRGINQIFEPYILTILQTSCQICHASTYNHAV